jgi:hypothetical protein
MRTLTKTFYGFGSDRSGFYGPIEYGMKPSIAQIEKEVALFVKTQKKVKKLKLTQIGIAENVIKDAAVMRTILFQVESTVKTPVKKRRTTVKK